MRDGKAQQDACQPEQTDEPQLLPRERSGRKEGLKGAHSAGGVAAWRVTLPLGGREHQGEVTCAGVETCFSEGTQHVAKTVVLQVTEVGLVTAFVFGAISFVSPCVLPLLPGYLSLMSGYSVAELEEGTQSTAHMLKVTSLFVAGFTVVFVALGAVATSVGDFLVHNQRASQRVAGWLVVIFGLILVLYATGALKSLNRLLRDRQWDIRPSRFGVWAAPVMGLAFGFAWTPCIGLVLGPILTLAATQDTVLRGMVLLLAYSLGLGVPFILAGVGTSKAFSAMKFMRGRLRTIEIASGALLMGFGFLMITDQLFYISSWLQGVLDGTFLERLANI